MNQLSILVKVEHLDYYNIAIIASTWTIVPLQSQWTLINTTSPICYQNATKKKHKGTIINSTIGPHSQHVNQKPFEH